MISLLKIAEEFARFHHKDQMYGNLPYSVHLIHCQDIAKKYLLNCYNNKKGENKILRTSLWLHDIVEDTEVNIERIYEIFGQSVGCIVDDVTDQPLDGETRKDYKKRSYNQIAKSYRSAYVKLVDRCANIEFSLDQLNLKKIKMYLDEKEMFSEILDEENISYFENLYGFYQQLLEESNQLLNQKNKEITNNIIDNM